MSRLLSYLSKCKHCGSCIKDSKPNSGFVHTSVNSAISWCWSMSQGVVWALLFLGLMRSSCLATARVQVS